MIGLLLGSARSARKSSSTEFSAFSDALDAALAEVQALGAATAGPVGGYFAPGAGVDPTGGFGVFSSSQLPVGMGGGAIDIRPQEELPPMTPGLGEQRPACDTPLPDIIGAPSGPNDDWAPDRFTPHPLPVQFGQSIDVPACVMVGPAPERPVIETIGPVGQLLIGGDIRPHDELPPLTLSLGGERPACDMPGPNPLSVFGAALTLCGLTSTEDRVISEVILIFLTTPLLIYFLAAVRNFV